MTAKGTRGTTYRKRGLGQLPCTEDNCGGKGTRRGLCPKHYMRWHKNGHQETWVRPKGTGSITEQGYLRYGGNKDRQLAHRLVIADALGWEVLEGMDVHHINGDKLDNRLENLAVMTRADHSRLHVLADPNKFQGLP